MKYLSLFSGIEACSVAWKPLGWECVGVADIDAFPCAALAHHYPDIPNLGSVTDITPEMLAELGPIDLVVGGSPCQDLSVAGKGAGLSGERSGLFFEQLRIFHAARNVCGARYLLWENVPGAFSSNKGSDFASVVGALAGAEFDVPRNGWKTAGVATGENGLVEWATLDAQFFGVPQRRRRVFALLDTGDWASRPPILFKPESLCGDSTEGGEAREDTTASSSRGAGGGSFAPAAIGDYNESGVASSLRAKGADMPGGEALVFDAYQHHGWRESETVGPLTLGIGKGVRGDTPLVGAAIAFHPTQDPIHSVDVCHALGANSSETAAVAFAENQRGELTTSERDSLSGGGGKPGQGYPAVCVSGEVTHPLTASIRGVTEDGGGRGAPIIAKEAMKVRRLTPMECERLQGFPDNYTQIPYRNKPADKCPDGPRYKALGNSMAVPVMRWIGEQIMVSK